MARSVFGPSLGADAASIIRRMTSGALAPTLVRRASVEDAALLASLAATAFSDTFAADNTADNMARYMASAFGEGIQHAELADARNVVFIAEREGAAAGYVMLRDGDVPACVGSSNAIEIARLYSTKRYIGAGVGSALMQVSIRHAAAVGREVIWLGVWERNTRAIAFYERWGFVDVGTQSFQLGEDLQTDRVLRRVRD